MRTLNVAAAAVNQAPLDWDGNRARLLAVLADARAARVAVLCLPEMCITGYGCEDAFHARHVVDTAWSELAALLSATRGMVVSFGLPVRHRNGLFNGAVLVVDGTIAGIVCKRHLAGDGVHYEPRWFKPWPADVRSAATLPIDTPAAIPIGDIHFDIGGVRIGFEICEDAWVATRPGGELARQGVDIILNPSASHFAFGKHEIRQRFVVEGSRAFGVTYVYANLLGNEAGRVIYDGGALIASGGEMVARGRRFSFRDHELVTAVVDLDRDRTTQVRTASFQPDVVDRGDTVSVDFTLPSHELAVRAVLAAPDAWESGNAVKEEEFTRAVALGLWDYVRKSGATGFVLSLSGGADSSACVTLVQVAMRLAAGDLGGDWARRLPKAPEGVALDRDAPLAGRLLCLYQRTAQSSATTEASARTVAQGAGAAFHVVDIDAMVAAYRGIAEEVCGREMSWTADAIALQNVQARARGPGVWMLANLRGALLLTTSNRSEAAVGYATMDGDTCGGVAPLAGIDKHYLRSWLRWMETDGPEGIGPSPYLRVVNALQPTAELMPAAAGQTDEGDLMPFPVLDRIERFAIHDKQSPAEALARLRVEFPMHQDADLRLWVRRFFTLWRRNQWKRERYAPSFHLDDVDLDPRAWCRFPILSGAWIRELDELDRS
ncbi:MAG: NAD(+) synthase [Myxococcales bacterium]|nr:NAD(+) synthase [Myxococcales bacterium]